MEERQPANQKANPHVLGWLFSVSIHGTSALALGAPLPRAYTWPGVRPGSAGECPRL